MRRDLLKQNDKISDTKGRAINSKMLPADAGCIVDNVETIIAIYNAVKLGKPVMNRVSTITGDAVANPGNFLYYIGTNYAELVRGQRKRWC